MRCKYASVLSVIRHQLGSEPEQGDMFIVMSQNRRLVRLFTYDRISCSLFEKRFIPGYRFMRVERDGDDNPEYKIDWRDVLLLLESPECKIMHVR